MPWGAWPNTDLSAIRVSAEMATVRPRATTTTSHMGPAVTPATKVRNSEINMPKGGKAPRPSSARTASAAVAGATSTTPWILARLRVPKACWMLPDTQKASVLVKPWNTQCSRAAAIPSGPPIPRHRAITPTFSTDEYAKRRLRSSWRNIESAATKMDSVPTISSRSCGYSAPTAWMVKP